MLINERRKKIVEIVNVEENISNKELSQRLDVSEMTLWRDLKELESQGMIRRVRGGVAKERNSFLREPQFDAKQKIHIQEKLAIARYAAENFVTDGDIIILEGGTTVASMVQFLIYDDLTILTNGFKTIMQALPSLCDMSLMICGGILREPSYTLVGPQAEAFFAGFQAHKFFVSGSGLSVENGLTDLNLLEIQVKIAMWNSAERTILLMDSSKFGKSSLASIVRLESIDILVTDEGAPQEMLEQFRELGMEIHVAKI
ncbi:MAG: DeoR/GlpR family DNA-binding transcription regulator [Anaerolineales bacterium]|jgi:DeoR/GlpR family transcriptional regulator of sugar metabolism